MKSRNKDHKPHESIIGKIIYGFLLFMPLLAIGVTCAYAIFNKNAYQSYYGDTINNAEIIQANNFEVDKEYTTTYTTPITIEPIQNSFVYVTNMEFLGGNNNVVLQNLINHQNDYWRFRYTYNANNINLEFQRIENNQNVSDFYSLVINYNNNPVQYSLSFKYRISENKNNNPIYTQVLPYTTYIEYNSFSFVSEVFYYSIDKVQQSTLFNWAEDSLIYTGMTNTCNALNITTPFIPLLMTYWLIISVIYILYDIILVILHIFHKKIHQLEDSF